MLFVIEMSKPVGNGSNTDSIPSGRVIMKRLHAHWLMSACPN